VLDASAGAGLLARVENIFEQDLLFVACVK